jgi:hypothetical protein
MNNVSLPGTCTPFRCDSQNDSYIGIQSRWLSLKSHAHAKIVNLVHDPLFEDRLGNSPRKAARQNVTWEEPRSLLPPENSIPRVFARPCISQRRKGEAPSSINGLKRLEVSLETL